MLTWLGHRAQAHWLISERIWCEDYLPCASLRWSALADDGGWSDVAGAEPILVHVLPREISERHVLEKLTESLAAEIAEHDVEWVRPLEPTEVPAEAKGLSILAGWVAIQVSFRSMARLVQSLAGWAARNNRDIEIRYGDDVIHVTHATSAQQDRLIGEWLDRHARP